MANAVITIAKKQDLRNTMQVHFKLMQGRSQVLRNTAVVIENYHGTDSFRNDSIILNANTDPHIVSGKVKAVFAYSKQPFIVLYNNGDGEQSAYVERMLFLDGDLSDLVIFTESEDDQEILVQVLQG